MGSHPPGPLFSFGRLAKLSTRILSRHGACAPEGKGAARMLSRRTQTTWGFGEKGETAAQDLARPPHGVSEEERQVR
jgi:hypothetical protein